MDYMPKAANDKTIFFQLQYWIDLTLLGLIEMIKEYDEEYYFLGCCYCSR